MALVHVGSPLMVWTEANAGAITADVKQAVEKLAR